MFIDPDFRMTVENVFAIGKRPIATGQIEQGMVQMGQEVYVHRDSSIKTAVVAAIEMNRKKYQQAQAGNVVGLILSDIAKDDVQQGDVLSGNPRAI